MTYECLFCETKHETEYQALHCPHKFKIKKLPLGNYDYLDLTNKKRKQ